MNRICALACILLFVPSIAVTEDPERGRLPDGRAFRTDVKGHQIVDYIAELEVAVESLNRRVHGLEYEVEEKDKTIARLSSGTQAGGKTTSQKFTERDLLGNEESQSDANLAVQRVAQSGTQPVDCSEQISTIQAQLSTAQEDLEIERQVHLRQVKELEGMVSRLKEDLNAQKVQFKERVEAEKELRVKYEKEKQDRMEAQDRAAPKPEIFQVKAQPQTEQPTSPAVVSASGKSGSSLEVSRSRYMASRKKVLEQQRLQNSRLSEARKRAVDSLRGSVRRDYNQLARLIGQRDKMFREYNKDGKQVSFKPQATVSSRKKPFRSLNEEISQAASVQELARVQKDIREITRKMNEDISLIRRMS